MFLDHSYAEKLAKLCTATPVTPLKNSRLALYNQALAEQLELTNEFSLPDDFFAAVCDPGSALSRHAIAQKYGGHQFGGWNPELGDGRGLLLSEVVTSSKQRWDLHLKGAGKTPYSRFGDGRAVLRSTIREYIASEALHHLGIPSSRSLCLITSTEPVYRETQEFGASMVRVAKSHLRFGHFEYFYHSQQHALLTQLFDYTFTTHFPEFAEHPSPHAALLSNIVASTAEMVAKWQAYGFCHGVMNTDNMSIHGITFDFGPYAFLDAYEPSYICNHSDHNGRYAFDQQPGVALWNLNALAHAFSPFIEIEQIKIILAEYEVILRRHYAELMRKKLGLISEQDDDMLLINDLLAMLAADKRDYTQTFRLLGAKDLNSETFANHFIQREKANTWFQRYSQRTAADNWHADSRQKTMNAVNPKFILRNYLAQIAIDRAQEGDFSECQRLIDVLSKPFDEHDAFNDYAKLPPNWGQGMEISCSS